MRREPLDVILKVLESPDFSKNGKKRMLLWAIKETRIGRRKRRFLFEGWIPAIVSSLINVINIVTN